MAAGRQLRSLISGSSGPFGDRSLCCYLVIRGGRRALPVLGTFDDRVERDLTSETRLTITNSDLARTDKKGKVRPLSDGTTELRADHQSHLATTTIEILDSQKERPFHFQRDIGGVLTKMGCNGSYCHGGVKGKGGFKLSVNAIHPEEDYQWIVRGGTFQVLTPEPAGELTPRINIEEPEKSLLLLKPTYTVKHGGGELLAPDDPEHQTLLNWIRQGGKYEDNSENYASVKGLDVFPREVVLDKKGKHQILVNALLPNGKGPVIHRIIILRLINLY